MKNFLSLFVLSLIGVSVAVAAPPGSPFNLGESLDPGCAPGDTNCTVVAPAASGDNSDITTLNTLSNVGIGTASSSTLLDIQSTAAGGELAFRSGPPESSFSALSQGYAGDARNRIMTLNEGGSYGLITVLEDDNTTPGTIVSFQGYAESTHDVGLKSSVQAVVADAWHTGDGNVTEIFGLGGFAANDGAGTATALKGLKIFPNTNNGGGTVGTNYGIQVQNQNGVGSTNYGIRVESAAGDDYWVTYNGVDRSSFITDPQGYIDGSNNVFAALNSASTGRSSALLGVHEDNSTSLINGTYGYAESTHTSGTRNAAEGVSADVYHSGAGGTVSNLHAVAAWAGADAGTVTNMASIHARTNFNGGATVTNNYGIHINDQSGVGTNNYGLYYNGPSKVVIDADGSVGIGTDTPSYFIHGNRDQTAITSNWIPVMEIDNNVVPSANAPATSTRLAIAGYSNIPNTNSNDVGYVTGVEGDVENYGTGNVEWMRALVGYAYNDTNVTIDTITGLWAGGESNAGTVTNVRGVTGNPTVWGGSVTNMAAVNVGQRQISGGTVTNRYGIYIHAPTGSSASSDDYEIYAAGSGANLDLAGTWNDASSRELKENIESLTAEEALEILVDLDPVHFNYKVNPDDPRLGFIAEDVPEAVASENRKTLSSLDIVAVLTKALQAQVEENAILKELVCLDHADAVVCQ